jgi:hypothetical protein
MIFGNILLKTFVMIFDDIFSKGLKSYFHIFTTLRLELFLFMIMIFTYNDIHVASKC